MGLICLRLFYFGLDVGPNKQNRDLDPSIHFVQQNYVV